MLSLHIIHPHCKSLSFLIIIYLHCVSIIFIAHHVSLHIFNHYIPFSILFILYIIYHIIYLSVSLFLHIGYLCISSSSLRIVYLLWISSITARHWSSLHIKSHTATHCNTLQHTATHCNTLQHTATHCNTLSLIFIAHL